MGNSCPRKKRRSRKKKKCNKGKCHRPGRIGPNPFLNFLRDFRKKHCGWSAKRIAIEGARAWCKLCKTERRKYLKQACCIGGKKNCPKSITGEKRKKRKSCKRKKRKKKSCKPKKTSCKRKRKKSKCGGSRSSSQTSVASTGASAGAAASAQSAQSSQSAQSATA